MKYVCIFLACFLITVCPCCSGIEIDNGKTELSVELAPGTVSMELPPINFVDDTKTTVSVSETSGLKFTWAEGDAVGVYSQEGGFARFSLAAGAGTSTAVFDGQGFSLTQGNTYRALYPYSSDYSDPTSIPISYSFFSISGDDHPEDLIPFDPLYASATADETGAAGFDFHHVSSFARLRCTMPSAGTFTRMDLFPTYGELVYAGSLDIGTGVWTSDSSTVVQSIPVVNVNTSSAGQELALWVPLAPQDMRSNDMAAILFDSSGHAYTARLAGKNLLSGSAYRWNVQMTLFDTSSSSSGTAVSQMYVNDLSSMPSGQYSGITHIAGTSYAVVHDAARGGGIYFFDLSFNNDGSISGSSYSIPSGTSSATNLRDPEGVAYFPKSNTLFVSGESDQQILEYDMNGIPTGRSLAVPDMSVSEISANYGFEALDYNAVTEKFWTTTEYGLIKDTSYSALGGQLLRLQSYNSDLTLSERYLYVLDRPQRSSSTARNYAFGVPDMLALDNGKLLIIEREAYIPSSTNYMDILFKTVIYLKIYEVDPVNDGGGVLGKKLVNSFTFSGALNYSNYEGICFGPVLDGHQTILMISDSQDRYQGLLKDCLMVLSLSGTDS